MGRARQVFLCKNSMECYVNGSKVNRKSGLLQNILQVEEKDKSKNFDQNIMPPAIAFKTICLSAAFQKRSIASNNIAKQYITYLNKEIFRLLCVLRLQ